MKHSIRWLLVAGGVLAAGIGGAIAIRVQTWPCGRWDNHSGCVANVQLDIEDLDFIPGTAWPSIRGAFDLSANADTMLVGVEGFRRNAASDGRQYYAVLALFDVQTGDLLRVLRELEGVAQSERASVGSLSHDASIREVALSLDGQFAASYGIGASENSLIVQRTSDGEIERQIFSVSTSEVIGCGGFLDFSADNQFLECRFTQFRLADGAETSITEHDGTAAYPRLSDFASLNYAWAPDGTEYDSDEIVRVNGDRLPLQSPLDLFDSSKLSFMFAPNSSWLLEADHAYIDARGRRRFVPPPFRRLSAIAVWNVDAELQQAFYTNKRFAELAWSRDSQYFAVLNRDLTVQVFRSPGSSHE